MKNNRNSENGFATILVLVLASILFILVSVAVKGYFSWQMMNGKLAEENRASAEKISVSDKE